ncbi:MAG: YihY/virulence factor BrkB family protein [Bacteroidota bacterium]
MFDVIALKFYWSVLKDTVSKFLEERVFALSAALSYYTIFSLPPMLLVILVTATQFYNEEQVKQAIFTQIGDLVGMGGAAQLSVTLDKLNVFEPTWWAKAVGIGALVFTATTVFVTMQDSLNAIYDVQPAKRKTGMAILKMLRDRLISFGLLVSLAFILLVSLAVNALIAAFGSFLEKWIGEASVVLVNVISLVLPLAIITVLFAMMFKFLPDIKLKWKDTWFGAFVTALLFSLGKYLISFYIGRSSAAGLYDAAGSVMVIMLWVYYASVIFFFGATFTYIRASKLSRLHPADYAVKVEKETFEVEKGSEVEKATNSKLSG